MITHHASAKKTAKNRLLKEHRDLGKDKQLNELFEALPLATYHIVYLPKEFVHSLH